MFTGLVAELGSVEAVTPTDGGAGLSIRAALASDVQTGDSIAINGVCLTATTVSADGFEAEAIAETLSRSSLGSLAAGSQVNLELAMRLGDRLGGHVVQGHVDGLGTVQELVDEGSSTRARIAAAADALRYVVEKGSITVDGVSLTVAEVDDASFAVALIPETLRRTTLGSLTTGRLVNLEVDVMAKYLEKLAAPMLDRRA